MCVGMCMCGRVWACVCVHVYVCGRVYECVCMCVKTEKWLTHQYEQVPTYLLTQIEYKYSVCKIRQNAFSTRVNVCVCARAKL